MRIVALSHDETTLYKGIGILLIVLHNYLHNIPPYVGSNEFSYSAATAATFWETLTTSPSDWVRALFSYLGHYGVQIFVFLSAYGLTRRYRGLTPAYVPFLKARFGKVYLPFVGVVLVYSLLWPVRGWLLGDPEPLAWQSLLLKLALVSNVVPGEALRPVGPWWFLPFIFQFYLVFPLLTRAVRKFGPQALAWVAGAALGLEWAVEPVLRSVDLSVNHTVIGHLPLFCLGVYAGARHDVRVPAVAIAAVAAFFVAANLHRVAWLVADLAAGVLLIVLLHPTVRRLTAARGISYRVLAFFGAISMPLFLVNGFLRSPFTQPALVVNRWWFTLACAGASLLFASFVAVVVSHAERRLRTAWAGRDSGLPQSHAGAQHEVL
jgi:peptidoglycan/LPS O-acetylase OafA/YrhL